MAELKTRVTCQQERPEEYVETENSVSQSIDDREILIRSETHPNSEAVENALSIHVILKKILAYLPIKDLLICSMVNHLWNTKCRSILRNKRKCLAKISSCEDIKNFYTLLQSSHSNNNNFPFNGFSVTEPSSSMLTPELHKCVKILFAVTFLDLIRAKHLHLNKDVNNCPAVSLILIRGLLATKAKSDLLESLSIGRRVEGLWSLPELEENNLVETAGAEIVRLPNLRTLKLPCKHYYLPWNSVNDPFIKDVLLNAPHLKEVSGAIEPDLLEFILTESKVLSSCVKELVFEPTMVLASHGYQLISGENLLHLCSSFAEKQPTLRKLHISAKLLPFFTSTAMENDIDKVSKVALLLLQCSCNSLEQLIVAHRDLIYFHDFFNSSQYSACLKLNSLTVIYTEALDVREGFSTLSRINFNAKFPNLRTVKLFHTISSYAETQYFITQEFRNHNSEFVCSSVTYLNFGNYDPTVVDSELPSSATRIYTTSITELIYRFVKIFPNVKHFVSECCFHFGEYCSAIFIAWPGLESLTFKCVKFYGGVNVPNFDSCLTGISEEDCQKMYISNCYGDKTYEISNQSSILNLRNLKLLRIKVEHGTEKCGTSSVRTRSNKFLSEVSGHCAFARMPGLIVEIVRDVCVTCDSSFIHSTCDLEMMELFPFANVKLLNSNSNPDWAEACVEF